MIISDDGLGKIFVLDVGLTYYLDICLTYYLDICLTYYFILGGIICISSKSIFYVFEYMFLLFNCSEEFRGNFFFSYC